MNRIVPIAAVSLALLAGCGPKADKKPGQALASVNGDEITVLQLNDELQRANIVPAQQAAASKQILEALIDRQLLQSQAAKENLDRDPKVVQAVERAKSMIVAQAYLAKHVGNVARPTKQEVEDYYQKNPQLFAGRKVYGMNELVLAAHDFSDQVKAAADSSKSIDELSAWLDAHKIAYGHNQITRTSADMPPDMAARLANIPKGQLFIVKENDRVLVLAINDVKDAPLTLENAAPQIDQFLFNKRNKEAAEAEVARLRATAKVEYMNQPSGTAAPAASAPAATTAAAEVPAPSKVNEQGVAGLK